MRPTRPFRQARGWTAILAVALAGATAGAQEFVAVRPIAELTITREEGPDHPPRDAILEGRLFGASSVLLDVPGEAFLFAPRGARPTHLVVRLPEPREEVTGRIVWDRPGAEAPTVVRFRTELRAADEAGLRLARQAEAAHFAALADSGVPGAAWFRHRARQAGGEQAEAAPNRFGTNREPAIDRGLALFGGGRAVRENLQLDRNLLGDPRDAGAVPFDQIEGITVAEIDWAPLIAGKSPALDPLAARIPADQHALFLPDLKAVAGLTEVAGRFEAIPALQVALGSPGGSGVLVRYERQLGLGLADLKALVEMGTIRSVALTGSDPYFPDGTDVALLFETTDPRPLVRLIEGRLRRAEGAEPVEGTLRGVAYRGARSPDRLVSGYLAEIDGVVILTNSPAQLDRLIAASKGEAPRLGDLPEFAFFRDRYARETPGELAFLVLSDATIRRWCGPHWRIAASRRLRAGAWLADLQARHLRDVLAGKPAQLDQADAPEPLGALSLTPAGVASDRYGTLGFLTPIVELDLSTATSDEANAYNRWRDGYQRNWRGVFDPIALRLVADGPKIEADVTVMPLIVASEYRTFAQLAGSASLTPQSGDPHPEAILHAALAIDRESALLRQGGEMATSILNVPRAVALSWLGPAVSVYLDADPFWAEAAQADDPVRFLSDNWPRLPVAFQAEVTDPARLALFLTALRAFADQTAPGLLRWETVEHGERSFVRISPAEGGDLGAIPVRVHYAATPGGLTISLSETVIRRFLDRVAAGPAGDREPEPWAGESLALRARPEGLAALGRLGGEPARDRLRELSYASLPILNEWRRLFPDRDPVEVHEAAWGVRLQCPTGARYVWNASEQTMESTAFGHPAAPKPGPDLPDPLAGLGRVDLGVTLRDGGLRGRVLLEFIPLP